MNFNNWFGGQQHEVGPTDAIKQWSQLPTLNNPQQLAQYATLARGLGGLFQQQPNFEPIKQQYMRDYRNNVLPGILSNATNSGFGQGSGFQQAVAGADTDLAYRLAALQQNFNQHQFDKNREYSQGLLKEGMKPSHENLYAPVPYDAAEQYLKRQGNPNPTTQEIEAVIPKFSPPRTVGQEITSLGQQGYQKAKGAYDVYQKQGVQGLKNLAKGQTPLAGDTSGYGVPQTTSELRTEQPSIDKALTESLGKASADQKAAADWILANKKAAMPILNKRLEPEDYVMLRSLMENPKPEMEKLAYAVSEKKDLEELRKVLSTQDIKKIRSYILRKYAIKE
jgi:hypothetical protein